MTRQHRPCRVPRSRLGTAPDRQLAREYGCSSSAVRLRRVAEGVPAYVRPSDQLPDGLVDDLGVYTDATVAAVHDVAHHRVAAARRRLGIPAARSDLYAELPTDPADATTVEDLAAATGRHTRGIGDTLLRWFRLGRVQRRKVPRTTGRQGPQAAWGYWRTAAGNRATPAAALAAILVDDDADVRLAADRTLARLQQEDRR